MSKRALDMVVAGALLLVLWPVWVAIAAGIKLTSSGPILYAGRRVGRHGREFLMFKFRSMYVGADARGPGVTGGGDPRVTPLGRFLRATKLDELPQLINVVRGDMSLVGPRPEAPQYVRLYPDEYREVLRIRPGITGPTQIVYRHEERLLAIDDVERYYVSELLPRKLAIDLAYVRSWSIRDDVRIIVATLKSIVGRTVAGG